MAGDAEGEGLGRGDLAGLGGDALGEAVKGLVGERLGVSGGVEAEETDEALLDLAVGEGSPVGVGIEGLEQRAEETLGALEG
jgi:hypothetical protein